jgi:hypothetical protein
MTMTDYRPPPLDEVAAERAQANYLRGLGLLARYGCRETMCRDCAFRPDSPESAEAATDYPSKLGTLREDLDFAFAGECDRLTTFVCHQGMPTGPKGPPDYQPPDAQGNPVGFPLCKGWAAAFDAKVAEMNERMGADGEAATD